MKTPSLHHDLFLQWYYITKKQKPQSLLYRNCGFCLARKERFEMPLPVPGAGGSNLLSGDCSANENWSHTPVKNIVVSGARVARFRYSLFFPLSWSLYPPPAALPLQAPAGSRRSSSNLFPYFYANTKKDIWRCPFCVGAEGEIWTLAPVTRPTPLAGAPLHHLSTSALVTIKSIILFYEMAEGKGFEPLWDCSLTVFKTASLWPLRYPSVWREATRRP